MNKKMYFILGVLSVFLIGSVFVFAETLKDVVVDSDVYQYLSDKSTTTGQTVEAEASNIIKSGIEHEQEKFEIEASKKINSLRYRCINENKAKQCITALEGVLDSNQIKT